MSSLTVNQLSAPLQPLVGLFICAILAYLFRSRIQSLLTPKGLPGLPAFADASPILGDIPRIAASLKESNDSSSFFARMGKDLGPIAQVRLTAFKT
jgi:hypothetical protein